MKDTEELSLPQTIVRQCPSMAVSDHCGYSSIIQHQIPQSGSFFKICCNVESETVPVNFSHPVLLKSNGLACTLNRLFTPCITPCLVNWKICFSLSYVDLPNVGRFHYTILKNHIINIKINHIKKVFKYWEAVTSKF